MTLPLLSYQYVVLRAVPRVDRDEFINVGVVIHSQDADFLDCAFNLDPDRLRSFSPELDLASVEASLETLAAADRGEGLQARFHRRQIQFGGERPQPVRVEVEGAVQEVGVLAVDDDTDVDELVAVDPRHGAQNDVLVAQQRQGHEGPFLGSHADGLSRRASRLCRYAVRTDSASGMISVSSSHSSGTWARTSSMSPTWTMAARSSCRGARSSATPSRTCLLASNPWLANLAGFGPRLGHE